MKIHEQMITKSDSPNTFEIDHKYIILDVETIYREIRTISGKNIKSVNSGFSYNSGENQQFLNIFEIRKLIIQKFDSTFKYI